MADGWSLDPLSTDLAEAYRARVEGRCPQWSPLPLDYLDHARGGRTHTSTRTSTTGWRSSKAPHRIVAAAGPGPIGEVNPEVGAVHVALHGEPAERVAATARRHRSTTFMTIHAALAAVLARHNDTDDIVIGTAVAGRGDPRLDSLVGMFASTLPLRAPTSGRADVRGPARARAGAGHRGLRAGRHPFDVSSNALHRNGIRRATRSSRWRSPSAAGEPAIHPPGSRGLRGSDRVGEHAVRPARHCDREADGLDFEFAYRSDLYEAATIEAFAARLIRFLDHVTADPGLPIGDVGLLTATERRGLVPASGADGSVAGLWQVLAAGAAEHPDRVAVAAGDRTVTYRQLVVRAESLARELVARGAGPGSGWPVRCRARSTR
ncbi:hypothetical protein GS934_18275 [Rhodococcus hoagii]|nr:hypothetical protein [Prescottella equi]NKZ88268.1 hypothetical protein [Prescottella equi]